MEKKTPATLVRELDRAQLELKRAREALRQARTGVVAPDQAVAIGWKSLQSTFGLLGSLPVEAAVEPVLTKQLAVQRSATSLLVRLRRLVRGETLPVLEDDFEGLEAE
jgi:hypothetical protein